MYTLVQFRNEGGFGWKLPDILFSAGYSLFRLLLVLEEIFSWNLSIGLFIGYKQSRPFGHFVFSISAVLATRGGQYNSEEFSPISIKIKFKKGNETAHKMSTATNKVEETKIS